MLLGQALERLPRQTRATVELRIVAELDYDEIARRLECSPAAARTRVHRGLAQLHKLMEEPS